MGAADRNEKIGSSRVSVVFLQTTNRLASDFLAIHRFWRSTGYWRCKTIQIFPERGKTDLYSLNPLPSEAPQRLSLGLHRHTGSGDRALWPISWKKIYIYANRCTFSDFNFLQLEARKLLHNSLPAAAGYVLTASKICHNTTIDEGHLRPPGIACTLIL